MSHGRFRIIVQPLVDYLILGDDDKTRREVGIAFIYPTNMRVSLHALIAHDHDHDVATGLHSNMDNFTLPLFYFSTKLCLRSYEFSGQRVTVQSCWNGNAVIIIYCCMVQSKKLNKFNLYSKRYNSSLISPLILEGSAKY